MKMLFYTLFLVWGAFWQIQAQNTFTCESVKTTDHITLSLARYTGHDNHQHATKKMLILPGKTCTDNWKKFIAQQFAVLGFDVYVLDFRGQGRSQRLTNNPQMVHVDNFDAYLSDVEAVILSKSLKGAKLYIYGHSMGGLVALLLLQKHKSLFQAVILEAPMTGINTSPIPYFLATPIAWIMVNIFKKSQEYCLFRGDYAPKKDLFNGNKSSHDRALWQQYIHLQEKEKNLTPSGPSWGWLCAAFTAINNFRKGLKPINDLKTKVFIASAANDQVVDNIWDPKIADAYHALHRVYPGAYHSLQHDSQPVRKAFFKDIGNFLAASN